MYSASTAISALRPSAYAKILSGCLLIRINRFSLPYGKYYSRNNYASCQFAFERLRNFYRLPTCNIWKKIFPNVIENFCSTKIHQDKFRIRYKFLKKIQYLWKFCGWRDRCWRRVFNCFHVLIRRNRVFRLQHSRIKNREKIRKFFGRKVHK